MKEKTCLDCMNFRTLLPLKAPKGSRLFTEKKLAYARVRYAWCRAGCLTMEGKDGPVPRIFKNPLRTYIENAKTLKAAAANCPEYDGEE